MSDDCKVIGQNLREAAGAVPRSQTLCFRGPRVVIGSIVSHSVRHGAQVASPLLQSPPLSSTTLRDQALQALSRARVSREREAFGVFVVPGEGGMHYTRQRAGTTGASPRCFFPF